MSYRREEKYLLDYRMYAMVKNNVQSLLTPDKHGKDGCYTVSSLYFDDPFNSAYYEKEDGLPVHTKFRIRSYDGKDDFLKLERKTKRGIMTEKLTAKLDKESYPNLLQDRLQLEDLSGSMQIMASEIRQRGLLPVVTVRYEREAFYLWGTDLRVTFDKRLRALPPEPHSIFDPDSSGIPALSPLGVIMEIKYTVKLPNAVRRVCDVDSPQLSVSKYALCRQVAAYR